MINSPTRVDHSYDKSTEKKQTTQKSSSFAPVTQPKLPSYVDHSYAGDKPKKGVTSINTRGDKKLPTEIDTRGLVSQGQGVDMKQDIEDTINIMKEYMDNIEKVAAQHQEKEKEALQQMKMNREKEVEKLIKKYGSKTQAGLASDEKRKEVIEDLLLTYGTQNKKKSDYLNNDQTFPVQTLQNKRKIITASPRKKVEVKTETSPASETFILRSRRPRPTSLHLILNE